MEDFVEIRFRVPRMWRDELQVAAGAQAVSLADLLRLIVRSFLRERYSPDERQALSS